MLSVVLNHVTYLISWCWRVRSLRAELNLLLPVKLGLHQMILHQPKNASQNVRRREGRGRLANSRFQNANVRYVSISWLIRELLIMVMSFNKLCLKDDVIRMTKQRSGCNWQTSISLPNSPKIRLKASFWKLLSVRFSIWWHKWPHYGQEEKSKAV